MAMANKGMLVRKRLSFSQAIMNLNIRIAIFKEICQGKIRFFRKPQDNLNKLHLNQSLKSTLVSILIKNHQNL